MEEIECISVYGYKKLISKDRLVFRPSVYAVIIHDGKTLLVHTRSSGKYYLPGGGINLGERVEEAVQREVAEETGVEIEVERFVHFHEDFFYYDPLDEAYHSFLFYYICRPKTLDIADDDNVDDEEAEKPRWIDIEGLQAEDFQNHGEIILKLLDLAKSRHSNIAG